MSEVVAFLTFNGNCREAMTFYGNCFGAELFLMPFSEAPGDFPAEYKNRVMHSNLRKGSSEILMAADTWPATPWQPGNNFSVAVQSASLEENERLFLALAEGGNITMPLRDTFWGARFGTLTDRFGIHWMFNCALP